MINAAMINGRARRLLLVIFGGLRRAERISTIEQILPPIALSEIQIRRQQRRAAGGKSFERGR
jgi:hypothetical protein